MRNKIYWLLALSLLLAGCAGNNTRDGDQGVLGDPVDIQYPQTVGDFSLVRDENNDDPVIGHILTYSSEDYEDLLVTVYVYFQGYYPTVEDAIDTQAEQLLLEFDAAEEAEIYTLGDMLSSGDITLETVDMSFSGHRYFFEVTTSQGADALSLADIFFIAPYFVKVRASFPGIGNTSYQQQVEVFEQQLLPGLMVSERVRCDNRLTVTPSPDGTEWVSVEGRFMLMDLDKAETEVEGELTRDEILAMPLVVALQRKSERIQGCADDGQS